MSVLSKTTFRLVLLYGGAMLFLLTTDPTRLPLPILIIPFIYLFVTIFLTVRTVARALRLSAKTATGVATTLSIFIVLLLVLTSLHQLSGRDILISVAITALLSWYMSRMQRS